MTREQIDKIWQKALHDSVKDGEQFTRYHFANAIVEECAKAAYRMPMNTAEEYNGYRSSDDCKAMAWDIQNAIRALRVKD